MDLFTFLRDAAAVAMMAPLSGDPDLRKSQMISEPTNAAEAAARQAAEEAVVASAYRAWKSRLPRAQQAWETTLEQNLGDFYFPLHQRDKIQGISNAWDYVADDPALPRVLLIGDSISRGYTLAARAALAGRANVHRASENCGPTANGLAKLDVWLGSEKWDLIVFNFGIHDRATPRAEYEGRLEQIIEKLQRTGARLLWVSSTPIPPGLTRYGDPAAIDELNRIGAKLAKLHGIAVVDLYDFITPYIARVQVPADVHFKPEGYELLGARVAQAIAATLPRQQ